MQRGLLPQIKYKQRESMILGSTTHLSIMAVSYVLETYTLSDALVLAGQSGT